MVTEDDLFYAGFITFVITSLSWALLWAVATIIGLKDKGK
jgi:hypothetical protein